MEQAALAVGIVVAVIGALLWVQRTTAQDRPGTTNDTAGRVDRLESRVKLLQGEWSEYQQTLDRLTRRFVRFAREAGEKGERGDGGGLAPETPTAPPIVTRADVLRSWQARQSGQRKE